MAVATAHPRDETEQFSGFPVRIGIFEGPLDLLLHLIRRQEVDISEVRVAAITDEYLRYLDTLAAINVEVAGEFLVMAANLLWLKSRVLLPRQDEEDAEMVEEMLREELIATEDELRQRLEEYRAYKEAAAILSRSQQARERVFLRPLTEDDEIGRGYVTLSEVSLFDMVAAVQEMLERTKEPPVGVVRPAEITVAQCIQEILLRLHSAPEGTREFRDLIDMPTTRVVIVMFFLATLELIRRRQVRVMRGVEARQVVLALVESP